MSRSRLTISECFGPVCQGEGPLIGKPTVFVRTGACTYVCAWCDTLYAVLPEYKATWKQMDTEDVFAEVQKLSPTPILVTLSGGNPAIQPLGDLIKLGHHCGYTFACETQGDIARSWMASLDHLILSPKPPSSKMVTRWQRLDACVDIGQFERHLTTTLKVVVFDEADYLYAKEVHGRYPHIPFYLQAGNADVTTQNLIAVREQVLNKLLWLQERVLADQLHDVSVLAQQHVLLYGNQRAK